MLSSGSIRGSKGLKTSPRPGGLPSWKPWLASSYHSRRQCPGQWWGSFCRSAVGFLCGCNRLSQLGSCHHPWLHQQRGLKGGKDSSQRNHPKFVLSALVCPKVLTIWDWLTISAPKLPFGIFIWRGHITDELRRRKRSVAYDGVS